MLLQSLYMTTSKSHDIIIIIIVVVILVCVNEEYCLCTLCQRRGKMLRRIGRQLNTSTINFQPQEYRRFSGNTREATGPL
jgi:hypothetical protein